MDLILPYKKEEWTEELSIDDGHALLVFLFFSLMLPHISGE
jgi:hypothetical protein